MSGFERVTSDTLAVGELRAGQLADGTPVCVGRADTGLFAVRDACPHAAFQLSNGTLLTGGVLECGWHGAHFDCRTGAVLEGPAQEPMTRFELRVEGGDVLVRPAEASA